MNLFVGDCKDVLSLFYADNSFDSVVTDPPYGLSFMGKSWDYDVPQSDTWAEILRVLKPGGHLLAFFGSRTYHRGVVQIEDAGFEIRDQIQWVYGSGFPKSHNGAWGGTALKPAHEPIVLARKPLIGTVDQNWREHGTGGLSIDKCRVPAEKTTGWGGGGSALYEGGLSRAGGEARPIDNGRWPANLIHDGSDSVLAAFPDAKGQQGVTAPRRQGYCYGTVSDGEMGIQPRSDEGSAARFFYCAKASPADRNEGVTAPGPQFKRGTTLRQVENAAAAGKLSGNTHPTVKPTDLMRYLCRLITPGGGTILDPFMGSGSTGKAAKLEGFNFVGIELDAHHVDIAAARIAAA